MKYCLVLAIILALQLFQSTHQAPLNETQPLADVIYRLPGNIQPTDYIIEITPYILKAGEGIKQFQFKGKVQIKFKVIEATSDIVLHVKDIEIIEVKLFEEETKPIDGIKPDDKPDPVTDFYKIKVGKELAKDSAGYVLDFTYIGNMKDDMKGFYYSKTDDDNVKYIGSTQFQTHHARRAFPCFDEPSFKAIFHITINHEKEFKKVYSNNAQEGPSTEIPELPGFMKSVFKETPRMSTYLVAFLISNFEGVTKDGFSVIARSQYKDQTQFSLDDGQKLLNALDDITGLPYKTIGIEKMDMAAIPDFSAGAMENWGLLTYRERGLLYDAAETTDTAQQSISLVIAHEQTHMWFGDLVTCDWWSHTWLNEGFARFFQYFAAEKVHTDWALDKQFVVDQIHSVFTTDSLAETHAMSAKDINSPADLAKMFGTISYNKGASIIRMFKYTMGEENFNKGIKKYLGDHVNFNGISTPEILFKHLKEEWKEENANLDKDAFFKDWTEKVGYPVVTVKLGDDRKKVTVSQKRFLLEDATEKDLKYTIPFTYTTQKDAKFDIPKASDIKFIKNSEESINFELAEALGESDYLIANIEQIGYFRVMYEEKMLHNIHHALTSENFGKISEVNRAHLIDDLFNFARAGNIKYSLVFDILSYLEKEKHYIPLTAVFNGLKYIETRLGDNTDDLKARVKLILPEVYKHLTFDEKTGDSRLDRYNRAKVLQWACKYDFDNCQKKASELFEEFKKDTTKNKINKNIRSAVYCSAVRTPEADTNYVFLEKHFKETKIPTEKTLTLSAMGCVKEKAHVEKYYKFILTENVRKQDKSAALGSLISENPGNAELVFDLIEKNHEELGTALGDGENDVATIVTTICNRFTTKEQKEKVEAFIKKIKDTKAKEKVEKAVKNIDKNMKWLEEYQTDLTTSLRGGVAAKAFSAVLITFTTILCYITMY